MRIRLPPSVRLAQGSFWGWRRQGRRWCPPNANRLPGTWTERSFGASSRSHLGRSPSTINYSLWTSLARSPRSTFGAARSYTRHKHPHRLIRTSRSAEEAASMWSRKDPPHCPAEAGCPTNNNSDRRRCRGVAGSDHGHRTLVGEWRRRQPQRSQCPRDARLVTRLLDRDRLHRTCRTQVLRVVRRQLHSPTRPVS